MILISRRPREIGIDWRGARSWFGGAPRLGGRAWPRGKNGAPLHFLAQIDFAEIAAQAAETPLPKEGSLAFFVGEGGGAVLFVPDASSAPPTLPPPETPDLTNCGGGLKWPFDLEGRALFPYWPIDFTRPDIEAPSDLEEQDWGDAVEAIEAAQNAAIAERFTRREYNLGAATVFAGPPIPDRWRCAIHVADELNEAVEKAPKVQALAEHMRDYARGKLEEARRDGEKAIAEAQRSASPPAVESDRPGGLFKIFGKRAAPPPPPDPEARRRIDFARYKAEKAIKEAETSVARYEKEIVKLPRMLPGLKAFAAEVAAWTEGRDPWSPMEPDDWARLGVYWARMTEFPEYTVHYGVTPLDYLKEKMFAKLPGENHPAFAALPAHVRHVIAGRRATRPQWWRTLIQWAQDMQEALARHTPYDLNSKREKLAAAGAEKAAELAELNAKEAAFRAFVADMSAWTAGREPLRPLSREEIAELTQRLGKFHELREIARAYHVRHLDDLESATLVTLATADAAAYATLPEPARTLINEQYLLPTSVPHQTFGQAVFIQGDACAQAEEGKLLLLQLGFDDMMFWPFGDNGAYTFWISPEDLAQRNWDGVAIVFECH